MAEESHGNGAYQLITPPNMLKAKVNPGPGGGGSGIDTSAIELATNAIESLADDFTERVTLDTAMLMKLFHDLDDDPSKAGKIAARVERIGYELSSQGETYGYNLISDVGASMCRYAQELARPEDMNGEVLRAPADTLRAVIKNQVKGDGGGVGIDLVYSLEKLVDRMIG